MGPSFSISTSLFGTQAACARAVTWVRQLLSPRAILRDGLSYEPSTTPHPSPQALGRWYLSLEGGIDLWTLTFDISDLAGN